MENVLNNDNNSDLNIDTSICSNESIPLLITHGPYISEVSDTQVRITWHTNLVSSGTVEYGVSPGEYIGIVTEVRKSLVTLDTRHTVVLTGLTPGTAYYYKLTGNRYYYLDNEVKRFTRSHCTNGGRLLEIDSSLPPYSGSFKTFDFKKTGCDFYFISDVNGDADSLNNLLDQIDFNKCDFVVYGGDQFGALESEAQIWNLLIDPSTSKFASKIPFYYIRGEAEYNGAFARRLKSYIPSVSTTADLTDMGRYYCSLKQGNASFAVLDTGVLQPDSYSGYQGLFAVQPYMDEQYKWLKEYFKSSSWTGSPFKIALLHNPEFGHAEDGGSAKWKNLLSSAGTQLVIAGHQLKYTHYCPGENGEGYHKIIVGQNQIARVNVTDSNISVTIYDLNGEAIDRVVIAPALTDNTIPIPNETEISDTAITGTANTGTANTVSGQLGITSVRGITPVRTSPGNDSAIVHQPYITAMTINSVIICWVTDPSRTFTGEIEYGTECCKEYGTEPGLGNRVLVTKDGLVTVGSFHCVKITGLEPGTTYHYRTVNVEVTGLAAGDITLGETITGKMHSFTTHSRNSKNYNFLMFTDTHNKVDPETGKNIITDLLECPYITEDYSFVVNGGDISNSIHNKETVYNAMIDPVASFSGYKPYYFIHGNHDNRGNEADTVEYAMPTLTGQWYYSFSQGNAAYAVIDCGDGYATWKANPQRLERTEEYLEGVYNWTKEYLKTEEWISAPLKVVFSHKHSFTAPDVTDELTLRYIDLFNKSGVKLVINGHTHKNWLKPPEEGRDFYQLSVGVFSLARFAVTGDSMEISIFRREPETGEWSVVDTYNII